MRHSRKLISGLDWQPERPRQSRASTADMRMGKARQVAHGRAMRVERQEWAGVARRLPAD